MDIDKEEISTYLHMGLVENNLEKVISIVYGSPQSNDLTVKLVFGV